MAAKVRIKQFNNTLFKIEINNSIANSVVISLVHSAVLEIAP